MHHTQAERSRRWRATPRGQFSVHKHNAHSRGVEFTLTYEQWWAIWQKSGKWKKRGNRKGCWCMCRLGDEGAYAQGNVFIGAWDTNQADGSQKAGRLRSARARKSTTVRYDDAVDAKVKTTYGAAEAPF